MSLNNENRSLKVCYIDGSLRDNTGHFANACRNMTGEMRRRGFDVDIFASQTLPPDLAQELGAKAFIRHYPFEQLLANSRLNYQLATASLLCDLRRIWKARQYDLVVINSVFPPQFAAAGIWLGEFGNRPAPRLAIEFGLSHHDDPLFKEAASNIPAAHRQPLLFTYDQMCATDYIRLVGKPFAVLPSLFAGTGTVRKRKADEEGAVTAGFLGYQRYEKGYQFLPTIIAILKESSMPVKFLIQNSNPTETEMDVQLRALANDDPSVNFEFRTGGQAYWQELLDRTDLMVLPYDRTIYARLPSGVAMEALSQGIPLIVPAGTTLESLVDNYVDGRGKFERWDPAEIAEVIRKTVADFEAVADATEQAAIRWRQDNGPAAAVTKLLQLVELNAPIVSDQSKMSSWSDGIKDATVAGLLASCKALRPIWLEVKRSVGKS